MVVRRAEDADIDVITSMYSELYKYLQTCGLRHEADIEQIKNSLKSQIRSKLFCILVAEDGEKRLSGFISASVGRIDRRLRGGIIGIVNDIYVRPSERLSGAASALLDTAEGWMRESGAQSVTCDIIAGNEQGLKFWHKRGYANVSISAQKMLGE